MTKTYRFADPCQEAAEAQIGVSAQVAGEELDRIRSQHGILEPGIVVDEARPDEAPLHPAFEWCDEKAAEMYREHQASNLIRRVRVQVLPAEPQTIKANLAPEVIDDQPLCDQFDPLAWELREGIGSLVSARRIIETVRSKASARFDRARVIQANVAIADIDEALALTQDAHEALVTARQVSQWQREPVAVSPG